MNDTATPTRKHTVNKIGIVTSDKREKTRTVAIEGQKINSKYGKRLKRESKYQVHDQANESGLGDKVEIAPCRPLSKTKTWRLVKVLEKAPAEVTHQVTATKEEETDAE